MASYSSVIKEESPVLPGGFLWHSRTTRGSSREFPIWIDSDQKEENERRRGNSGSQSELLTNGAVGPAPAGLGEVMPSNDHGSNQAADPPVPVPGSGESFKSGSLTAENSPTRYQQFRCEEDDSATTGGDAVASSEQACGSGSGASRRLFLTFHEERDKTALVKVVTAREEFWPEPSEQPAAEVGDSGGPANNNNEHCHGSCVKQDGLRPVPVDAEDNQWKVEALRDKRRDRYLVKWEGYPEEDNTWERRRDIHPDLVANFEKERGRGKTTAREKIRHRGVGKVYKRKKTGKVGRP